MDLGALVPQSRRDLRYGAARLRDRERRAHPHVPRRRPPRRAAHSRRQRDGPHVAAMAEQMTFVIPRSARNDRPNMASILIASDHAGFELKERLESWLRERG